MINIWSRNLDMDKVRCRIMAAEIQFLRSTGGETETDKIINGKILENLTFESKLTHNRIQWHGHILRTNEERRF
jgi:hypothetical protein